MLCWTVRPTRAARRGVVPPLRDAEEEGDADGGFEGGLGDGFDCCAACPADCCEDGVEEVGAVIGDGGEDDGGGVGVVVGGCHGGRIRHGHDGWEVVMEREIVETVTGPVAASELGFTLSHEHVIVGFPGIKATYPELMDWDGIESTGIAMLSEARAEGLNSIMDATPFELGRDVLMLRRVSEAFRRQHRRVDGDVCGYSPADLVHASRSHGGGVRAGDRRRHRGDGDQGGDDQGREQQF